MQINSSRPVPFVLGVGLAVHSAVLAVALSVISFASVPSAEAKTPGSTYCFYGKCHRVKSLAETEALVGTEETVSTSFYDSCSVDRYNPCGLTSSGEMFRPDAPDNAASPIYPDGTTLLVWSPESREAAVVRVNNAGPYWGNRRLDVSRATAEKLGFKSRGVADLKVRVIDAPNAAEATYKKNRSYEPVLGYLGSYESFDMAQVGMAAAMGAEAVKVALNDPATPDAAAAVAVAAGVETKEARRIAAAVEASAVQVAQADTKPIATAEAQAEKVAAVAAQAAPAVVAEKPTIAVRKVASLAITEEPAASPLRAKRHARARAERRIASRTPTRAARYAEARKAGRVASNQRRGAPVASAREAPSRHWDTGTNDHSVFSRHNRHG